MDAAKKQVTTEVVKRKVDRKEARGSRENGSDQAKYEDAEAYIVQEDIQSAMKKYTIVTPAAAKTRKCVGTPFNFPLLSKI